MLEIRVAPHWDRLLDMLAAAIRGSRHDDPLRLVRVLAPSPAAEAWLREALVVRMGVAARIEFALVERWLETGLSPEDRADRLTTAELRLELLALLLDESAFDDEALAPLRSTLAAVPEGTARRRRAFELASRLAPLFEEYALTRPDAIAAWRRSPAAAGTGVAAWQHALFRAALARRSDAGRAGHRFLCEIAAEAPVAEDGTPLFVVAPGFLAPAYTAALARRTVETPGLLLQLRIDATAPAFRALEDWSQPEELFLDAFAAAAGARILAEEDTHRPGRTWLDHLVRGEAAPAGDADDSLVVVDAPTPTREAEAVCDEIWRALLATRDGAAPLLPSDVLVLVAGADDGAYRSRLLGAAAARGLPVFEADAGAARRSGAVETAGDLLALVGSRFERQAVFRLLRRPAFRACFPEADAEAWERWAAELEVRHGRDDADHAGSYLPPDLYHWDQALARLALSRFLPEVEDGDPPLLEVGTRRLAPAPFAAEAPEVGRLSAVLRDLIARSRELGEGAPRPLRAWGRAFADLVEDFAAPAEGEDESVPQRIGAALRGLGEGAAAAALNLDFGSARAIALETVSGLAPRSGSARLRGITIAALGSVRPPAARMIAVVGLDEDRFPAGSRRSALDLRRDDARPEEPSPRARDLQRFAEVLRGVSERLVLGHRGRDAATGDAREPSVVVRDILAWSAGDDGAPRLRTRRIGSDATRAPRSEAGPPRPAPDGFLAPRMAGAVFSSPTAEELRALHLREAYRGATGREPAGLEDLLAAEGDPDALRRFLGLVALPSERPPIVAPDRRELTIDAAEIRAFLADPLQSSARFVAGLRAEDGDDADEEGDEQFDLGALEDARFLRETFEEALTAERLDALAEIHRERATDVEYRRAGWNAALFKERSLGEQFERLGAWHAGLEATGAAMLPFRRHVFRTGGDGTERAIEVEIAHPTGEGTLRVRITGRTELIALGEDSLHWIRTVRKDGRAEDLARALVDHALLAASGIADARPGAYHALCGDGATGRTVHAAAVDHETARTWLAARVGEILSGLHAYFLPVTVVHDQLETGLEVIKGRPFELETALAGRRAKYEPRAWDPLRRVEEYAPPADAAELIRLRFSDFLPEVPRLPAEGGPR